jgi:HEAT repeat protein
LVDDSTFMDFVRRLSSRHFASSACALTVAFSSFAAVAEPAFAPPGRGQPGLAVGSDAQGVLRAKLCARAPCTVDGGLDLGVPAELRASVPRAKLALVGIGDNRRAIVVTVPGDRDGRSFQAVVVAPLGGAAPKVLFAGLTGLREGADGVRQGQTVSIFDPDATGARSIVIGTEREDLDLCGRRAVLSPQVLNPDDLTLRPAKVQRLTPAERERATSITATRVAAPPALGGSVLGALGASSALGAPQLLTDGRADTAWVENRGGSGRGEFVVLNAPANLPIAGFDLVLTAPDTKPDPANVPRELWLVTRARVYHVTLPDAAASEAGARFRVALPKPEQTDCVAQVLESAFAERPDSRVAVAELSVTSEFENASPASLVGALAGGGERALAAGAVLRSLGASGFAEIGARFASLDEGGRRVALDVIDSAPCEASVPVYLTAFADDIEAQRAHAQARLRRCGRVSADGLRAGLVRARGEQLARYANELTLVDPARGVQEIAARLPSVKPAERAVLRVALARGIQARDSNAAVRRLLVDPATPPIAALDLLRALGARAPEFLPESGAALERLASDASFRTRYLLLAPAATLAARDPRAEAVLARALASQPEPDTFVRVRALEVAPRDPRRAAAFVDALADPNVRVREAAAQAIGEARVVDGAPRLIAVLDDDAWPIARRAAAAALGALPAEPRGDQALLDALADDAPAVRGEAAESLGLRRVVRAAPALRDHLEDPEEKFEVRRAAASALGALCDRESVDDLWKLVRRVDDPLATVEERALGEASLAAVVRISPPDLASQLEPLRRGQARKAVERALARSAQSRCPR